MIHHSSMEQVFCDLPQFVESTISVSQALLVLPLLESEPRITAVLKNVLHEVKHCGRTLRVASIVPIRG